MKTYYVEDVDRGEEGEREKGKMTERSRGRGFYFRLLLVLALRAFPW